MKIKFKRDEDGQVVELEEVTTKDDLDTEPEVQTEDLVLSEELVNKLVEVITPRILEAVKNQLGATSEVTDEEEEEEKEVEDEEVEAKTGKHDSVASIKRTKPADAVNELDRDLEVAKAWANRKGA